MTEFLKSEISMKQAARTITQSTDIMVGRMSWREVFGAPK
jgi:hypothetical protein